MDFSFESAGVVLADPKSITISSKYGEFCEFWNSHFGWTPDSGGFGWSLSEKYFLRGR
jgi:hypothetical protein